MIVENFSFFIFCPLVNIQRLVHHTILVNHTAVSYDYLSGWRASKSEDLEGVEKWELRSEIRQMRTETSESVSES
jgi:hypothetical protein